MMKLSCLALLLLSAVDSFSPSLPVVKHSTHSNHYSTSLSFQLGQQEERHTVDVEGAVATVQEETISFIQQYQEEEDPSTLMKVVYPPSTAFLDIESHDEATTALDILHRLDATLQEWACEEQFIKLIQAGDTNSVRFINARRFEVFVQTDGKTTEAFEWVATRVAESYNQQVRKFSHEPEMSSDKVKQILLDYAKAQANQADPTYIQDQFQYHNFAILINYGTNCPPQVPHIDLVRPNAQFGLILTNQVPGTVWYDPQTPISTPRELQQAWRSQTSSENNHQHNQDWVDVMENDVNCCYRLRRYGNVLSPQLTKYKTPLVDTGTLLSLPGGIVHAGPSCETFRAVLFFSGHPQMSGEATTGTSKDKVAPYNPDVQYFDSVLLSDMIAMIWTQLSTDNRHYLLERLVEYLARAPWDNRCMHKHLPRGYSMREFAEHLEKNVLVNADANGVVNVEDILSSPELQLYFKEFASQETVVAR